LPFEFCISSLIHHIPPAEGADGFYDLDDFVEVVGHGEYVHLSFFYRMMAFYHGLAHKVDEFRPVIHADHDDRHSRDFFALDQVEDVRRFVEGAVAAREKNESSGRKRQHGFADEKVFEIAAFRDVFICDLSARKLYGQAQCLAAGFCCALCRRFHDARSTAGRDGQVEFFDDFSRELRRFLVMKAVGFRSCRAEYGDRVWVSFKRRESGLEFFADLFDMVVNIFVYFLSRKRLLVIGGHGDIIQGPTYAIQGPTLYILQGLPLYYIGLPLYYIGLPLYYIGLPLYTLLMSFSFSIEQKLKGTRARAGVIHTPHGDIETPAFIAVGTKATVKSLTPEILKDIGVQAVLANTYHLYLQPGPQIIKAAGGFAPFMNWSGATMTDSGGFQVFSLGSAYDRSVSKVSESNAAPNTATSSSPAELASRNRNSPSDTSSQLIQSSARTISARSGSPRAVESSVSFAADFTSPHTSLAKIDENGVAFTSIIDGSAHYFTPEKSIQIQHDLGADIIVAFDECTAPDDPFEYQKEAMERTHRWGRRSLEEHEKLGSTTADTSFGSAAGGRGEPSRRELGLGNRGIVRRKNVSDGAHQALYGVVQGGRFEDLRKESARTIAAMTAGGGGFDGFCIGGSFDKDDIYKAVEWVTDILPEEKPRHLLGMGEIIDLFEGVERGIDTFDCVSPTRLARNGALYTRKGRINILNAEFAKDFSPIDAECRCPTCTNYSRAYIAHLFRSREILASVLASQHNLYFIVNLVKEIREKIQDGTFLQFKRDFLAKYYVGV